jgi:hypothetical protein
MYVNYAVEKKRVIFGIGRIAESRTNLFLGRQALLRRPSQK